jgi:ABC-type polysaccharide/polyol phosphate export permease
MIRRIGELLQHRELILRLAVKDLKVRYKSPWLGFLWALLVPVFMMVILSVVFSLFLRVKVGPFPFPLFLIAALFPWNFVALSLGTGTTNVVESGSLIKKVYFPREAMPIAVVLANAVNFLIAMLLLPSVILLTGVGLSLHVALLPVLVLLLMVFVTGITLLFSSLHVHYRDVKYIVEVLLLGWFYISPIIYPLRYVSDYAGEAGRPWAFQLYMLNPMAQFVTLFRGALLPGYIDHMPDTVGYWTLFGVCTALSLATFLLGLVVFERLGRTFADLT